MLNINVIVFVYIYSYISPLYLKNKEWTQGKMFLKFKVQFFMSPKKSCEKNKIRNYYYQSKPAIIITRFQRLYVGCNA